MTIWLPLTNQRDYWCIGLKLIATRPVLQFNCYETNWAKWFIRYIGWINQQQGFYCFALDSEMARKMMEICVSKAVEKHYIAVVRGYTPETAVIDYPLKEQLDKMSDTKAVQDKLAQNAVTHYQCLATVELPFAVGRYKSCRYSLLKLNPKTGRKHQLRRHMKHIFHPIVGDTSHGDGKHNDFFRQQFDCHRLLLTAVELQFQHPFTQEKLEIKAPLDDGFNDVMTKLGWNYDKQIVQFTM